MTGPTNGSLTFHSDGSFTYTPNAGFVGADSFVYQASDGTNSTGPVNVTLAVLNLVPLQPRDATVTLTVYDTAPVANGDSYSVTAGQTLNVAAVGVLGNDSDPDGDSLTAVLVSSKRRSRWSQVRGRSRLNKPEESELSEIGVAFGSGLDSLKPVCLDATPCRFLPG